MYRQFYRRNLPHWQPPGAIIFVTCGLVGSLPRAVEEQLRRDAKLLKQTFKKLPGDSPEYVFAWKKLFKYADDHMERSQTALHLRNPQAAARVVQALYESQSLGHYILHRYCIMGNHIHLLLEPLPKNIKFEFGPPGPQWPPLFYTPAGREVLCGEQPPEEILWKPLADIMHAIKGITSPDIARIVGVTGNIWMPESYDHWIRNSGEYERVVSYIDQNPVKAGLCAAVEDWPWSTVGEKAKSY